MTEVAAALIRDGEKFLIGRRPQGKSLALRWEFIGGKVEPGETREQALVRECREELGVTVAPGRVYAELTHEYPDFTLHMTLFETAVLEGTPRPLEHAELRWITPDESDDDAFCPADVPILRRLRGEMPPLLVWLPGCSTCRRAQGWLREHGIQARLRHIAEDPPSADELRRWRARSGLPLRRFFNSSGQSYRALGLKDRLPELGEEEQLALLAADGMLVRRPILVTAGRVLVGFAPAEWEALL